MYCYENNDASLPCRYCTSVGVYQGYDPQKRLHTVAVRNGNEELHDDEKRFNLEHLDEFQFMIWYACHGEIIKETDMYEMASKFWEEAEFPKRPLIKCYNELKERNLVNMIEIQNSEADLCALIARIKPYTLNFKSIPFLKKKLPVTIQTMCKAISSIFLSNGEKKILRYLRKNPNADFFKYISENRILEEKNYQFISDVNTLLYKGYIIPVGWTSVPLAFV